MEVMMAAIEVLKETGIRTVIRLAPLWRILIHNDPETPFYFVIDVLQKFFGKERVDAVEITWDAHTTGVALVKTVQKEQAEFLIERAVSFCRGSGYPLSFSAEPCE